MAAGQGFVAVVGARAPGGGLSPYRTTNRPGQEEKEMKEGRVSLCPASKCLPRGADDRR